MFSLTFWPRAPTPSRCGYIFHWMCKSAFHSGGALWSKVKAVWANCPGGRDTSRYSTDVRPYKWLNQHDLLLHLFLFLLSLRVYRSAWLSSSFPDQRLPRCLRVPWQPGLWHDECGQHRLHRDQHLRLLSWQCLQVSVTGVCPHMHYCGY